MLIITFLFPLYRSREQAHTRVNVSTLLPPIQSNKLQKANYLASNYINTHIQRHFLSNNYTIQEHAYKSVCSAFLLDFFF